MRTHLCQSIPALPDKQTIVKEEADKCEQCIIPCAQIESWCVKKYLEVFVARMTCAVEAAPL